MAELTKDEFNARFKARMMARVAPHTEFTSGESIAEYADQAAPTYWEDQHKDGETPEDCADADISYWDD